MATGSDPRPDEAGQAPSAADLLRDWRASGFLVVGLDGAVSLPYSDGIPESHRQAVLTLTLALGIDEEQEARFLKWLGLVRARHAGMRWDKLAAVCPVQDLPPTREHGPCRLEARKLGDGRGGLSALALFCVDTAASQAMARQLEEERLRHRLQIRDVLALSANPPETVGAFLEDAGTRLDRVRRQWDGYLAMSRRPGTGADPAGQSGQVGDGAYQGLWGLQAGEERGEGLGQRLFRELHMLKGNAGAFGFDGLAASVQESEDQLEALKAPGSETPTALQGLAASLAGLKAQLEEIHRAMKLISGEGQEAMVRILRWKLDRLQRAADAVVPGGTGRADASAIATGPASPRERTSVDPRIQALVDGARRLPWLSPAYLARKYRNLVDRLASAQGKEIRFRVAANTGEIHPESFSRIDEALVHILRNMVDHGIEPPQEREALGKGEAEIGWEYLADDSRIILHIRDDGRGMDPAALAARAAALGLLTREETDTLEDGERLSLIFREGFTTRDEGGMISGRGLGMALAARCVSDQGGHLSVTSEPGKGSCFTVVLPPLA
jgi:signal transduction histidine kinase